ncbi:MAG: glycine cleavage T C-terminal barrel domain-containing protein [Chloroflexota bacterium]
MSDRRPSRLHVVRPWFERSPYFDLTEAAGAETYEVYNRTYWPRSYGRDPREELEAVMERAVLIDVGCERIVEVTGARALEFVDYLCTRDLRTIPPDRARHTAVCEPNGELYCEALVLRPAEDVVWVGHGPVDFDKWARAIAAHTQFDVAIARPSIFPFAVQGPMAVEIMRRLTPAAMALPFFGWCPASIAGAAVLIIRSGWTGAPGFEVYPLDHTAAPRVWQAVAEAGAPVGLLVSGMTGPYFERGITDFVYGAGLGLNPFEARLGRVVDLDGADFVGRDALISAVEAGPKRRLVGLRFGAIDLPDFDGAWALTGPDDTRGTVIAARMSHLLHEWLGYAVVDAALETGSSVAVTTPGGAVAARVTDLPFLP